MKFSRTGVPLVAAIMTTMLVAAPARAAEWVWPVRGQVITSYSNDNSKPYAAGMHRGIDIAAPIGSPVVAAGAGQVSYAGNLGSSGLTVAVRSADSVHVTSYLHLSSYSVARGQHVGAGERIGAVGTTGKRSAQAPHLHFGVRLAGRDNFYIDPLTLLPAIGGTAKSPPPATVPAAAPARANEAPAAAAVPARAPEPAPAATPVGHGAPASDGAPPRSLPAPGARPVARRSPVPVATALPVKARGRRSRRERTSEPAIERPATPPLRHPVPAGKEARIGPGKLFNPAGLAIAVGLLLLGVAGLVQAKSHPSQRRGKSRPARRRRRTSSRRRRSKTDVGLRAGLGAAR